MGERLKLLIKALGMNQKEFAESIGVTNSNITEIIKGRSQGFGSSTLAIVSRIYNVNLHWLLIGEGEMFLQKEKQNEGNSISGIVINNSKNSNITVHLSGDEQELIQAIRKSKKKDVLKTILSLLKVLFFVSSIYLVYEAIEAMPDRPVKMEINQVQKDADTEKAND